MNKSSVLVYLAHAVGSCGRPACVWYACTEKVGGALTLSSRAHLPALVTIISFVTGKNCFHSAALSRTTRGSSASRSCSSLCTAAAGEQSPSEFPRAEISRRRCCSCCSRAACTVDQATVGEPPSRASFRACIGSTRRALFEERL